MAGQRNKNAFKFLLILLILSQKHILGVKKVVWDGLDVVWRWLGVVWGVSTDPPKMAFVFPISCILAFIFLILIKYFLKCEGKGSFLKSQIKSMSTSPTGFVKGSCEQNIILHPWKAKGINIMRYLVECLCEGGPRQLAASRLVLLLGT